MASLSCKENPKPSFEIKEKTEDAVAVEKRVRDSVAFKVIVKTDIPVSDYFNLWLRWLPNMIQLSIIL